jgi:hypothetical protein
MLNTAPVKVGEAGKKVDDYWYFFPANHWHLSPNRLCCFSPLQDHNNEANLLLIQATGEIAFEGCKPAERQDGGFR